MHFSSFCIFFPHRPPPPIMMNLTLLNLTLLRVMLFSVMLFSVTLFSVMLFCVGFAPALSAQTAAPQADSLSPFANVGGGRIQRPPSTLRPSAAALKAVPQPRTALDYFLLLPDEYFTRFGLAESGIAAFPLETRRKVLTCFYSDSAKILGIPMFTGALEIKNQYLVVHTPEGADGFSFAVSLWRLKNGKTLVGFCRRRWEREIVAGELAFLQLEKNTWKDVTNEVFAEIPLKAFLTWSGLKRHPNLLAPVDIELPRSEQMIIARLDMARLEKMPELKPIGAGLSKSVQIRTIELRLDASGVFVIANKY